MSFGEELKRIRKEKHMTQEALAASLNLNRATISKYESGQIMPPVEQVKKIAKALGVPYGPLLFGPEIMDDMERQRDAQRKAERETELSEYVDTIMPDCPDKRRARIINALLSFDPDWPYWTILEGILESVIKETSGDQRRREAADNGE